MVTKLVLNFIIGAAGALGVFAAVKGTTDYAKQNSMIDARNQQIKSLARTKEQIINNERYGKIAAASRFQKSNSSIFGQIDNTYDFLIQQNRQTTELSMTKPDDFSILGFFGNAFSSLSALHNVNNTYKAILQQK